MENNKISTIAGDVDNKEKYAADLDQALAVAGIGWYNIKYCLVLALFLIAAIVEPVGYSFVLPAAMCDLDMTDGQRGFIASIPYIDSTVVLGWLKMPPNQLKPFVQNRVVEVNELTGDKAWLHVSGKQNPADLLSRGMQLDMLTSSDLWWNGPPFLQVHGMNGIVATSFPWGYLVDIRGRKMVIIYASLLAGVFGITSGFMPNLISFAACKFLTSLCIACPAAVPYTFIGEILPGKYRDVVLSITNALQISGSALVPLIAWAILPLDFRIDFGAYIFKPWRLLSMIYASIFIIAAALLAFGPESPKYLVSQGKLDEALTVLQRIYAGNKKKSPEDFPIKRLDAPPHDGTKKSFLTSLKVQSLPLFKPPYLKWFALNGFLMFGIFSVLNGLYMWVPDVLNRVLTGDGEGMTACDVIFDRLNQTVEEGAKCVDTIEPITFVINSVANVSCAVIAVAVSSTVKFIGKKRLLIIVFFVIGTFCVLINFITQDMVFAVLMSSFPIMGLAIGPVNAYSVEFFPTNLRGMAVSLTMMLGRTGSIIGTNVVGILLNAFCELTFYLFGGLLILCGVLSFLLPSTQGPPINKMPPQVEDTRL